jgi:two-component system, OmpR family, sensor histidine kinase BaeS
MSGPPHRRPPWWPEGEAWPPEGWSGRHAWAGRPWDGQAGGGPPWLVGRRRRAHIRRRIGCFVVLFATVLASIGVLVLWLLATLIGATTIEGDLGHLARAASLVLLALVFIGLVAGAGMTRRIVGPVGELVDAAGRIEGGDYSARVGTPARAPRDLRALVAAFNHMAERLEAEEEHRRRLLADLGHELRTPIAVIEGHLEAVLDGVYPADQTHLDPILDETRVLARLIEDLRTVSLAESGSLTLHREPVDLGHAIRDVVSALGPRAEAAGTRLRVEVDQGIPELDLDPVRIHEVLSNLVDNAIRYTPPDGEVRVGAHRRGQAVEISVADDGPGLAPELRQTLFERFVKSPESPGSGLGLAIAKAIVEAHGGTIRAEAGDRGGTTIRLELPVA